MKPYIYKIQRSKQDPLITLDEIYDHSFEETNVGKNRTRNRKYQALSDALDEMEDVKNYWDRQSILHPDARSFAFTSFTKFNDVNYLERWSKGMVIFQCIDKFNKFIMNYNDGFRILPIHFVNAERPGYRVTEILWSWSQGPTKEIWSNYANAMVPYAVHKSYESSTHKFDGVDWDLGTHLCYMAYIEIFL